MRLYGKSHTRATDTPQSPSSNNFESSHLPIFPSSHLPIFPFEFWNGEHVIPIITRQDDAGLFIEQLFDPEHSSPIQESLLMSPSDLNGGMNSSSDPIAWITKGQEQSAMQRAQNNASTLHDLCRGVARGQKRADGDPGMDWWRPKATYATCQCHTQSASASGRHSPSSRLPRAMKPRIAL